MDSKRRVYTGADPALLEAAYSLVPRIIELIEEVAEERAEAIHESAQAKRFTYWRKLTTRENKRFKETGELPDGLDPEKDFIPSDDPRTPGMVRAIRKPLPAEKKDWERAKQSGQISGQSPLPLNETVDKHIAAAAIAAVLETEDILREDIARPLAARASVSRGSRGGSDARRLIAWLIGFTRQGYENLMHMTYPHERAGRDSIRRDQLEERMRKLLLSRKKREAELTSA